MKNIFIIGSKGIPAKYGGFETFVEKLTENQKSKEIKYHVACVGENNEEFEYNNARCFKVKVPDIGSAKAVLYDLYALKEVISYIRTNNLKGSIVYILACRIGPFISYYKNQLHKLDCSLYVNPDGHEWKRAKWNTFIKKYWKLSERLMIKNCDLAICDSIGIENYIKETYKKYKPNTTYIAYGANIDVNSPIDEKKLNDWYKINNLEKDNYYLIVGRFVPENNFEIMIREFMNSNSKRDLVIITNHENNKFYDALKKNTDFEKDTRIKFVGTVYDQELLKAIRINAFAYIHGHSVGGTNPSLLEAMATTNINLLLNIDFNIEVGSSTAIYWGKQLHSLTDIINNVETFSNEYIQKLGDEAKQIIKEKYSWDLIINKYENLFLDKIK
ncbi:beta 1-4 rhamnosyltransferase Cps2T [Thomasclavelia sp.]|uniref:beta 1-4 rhamnosyltransferase Cps2T n=1 Tax=Thomasclavelia sp. TaxID=3025757 RepID=UPI002635EA88|nr:DUF1972 domain-containing protein [Thomasclavelia sp.]